MIKHVGLFQRKADKSIVISCCISWQPKQVRLRLYQRFWTEMEPHISSLLNLKHSRVVSLAKACYAACLKHVLCTEGSAPPASTLSSGPQQTTEHTCVRVHGLHLSGVIKMKV